MVKKGIAEMKIRVLVILHSYMIPEHFYAISNTFLCIFRTLLYDPKHFFTIPC